MPERPILSFAEVDAFDPQGPSGRKWCPLCGEGKPKDAAHRSLSLDRDKGLWKCFRCGAQGQAREFWNEKPAGPRRQMRAQQLHQAFSIPTNTPVKTPERPVERFLEEGRVPGPEVVLEAQNGPIWRQKWESAQNLAQTPGEAYLRGRGIALEVAERARVKFDAAWKGGAAVVFPICDRAGEVVAVQGRGVRGDSKITYGPKKEGAFQAPIRLGGRLCQPFEAAVPAIVLVEAPIDALSVAACGFPALALCGTSGPWWLHIACGLRRVALAFDADPAGDEAAQATEARLAPFGARCERLRPQDFKDWNEWLQADGEGMEMFLSLRLLVQN